MRQDVSSQQSGSRERQSSNDCVNKHKTATAMGITAWRRVSITSELSGVLLGSMEASRQGMRADPVDKRSGKASLQMMFKLEFEE